MSEGKQIYYHNLRENLRKMNPRFKELAIQAGAYQDGDTILTGPMDVAKFAELIVRECASIVADAVDHREPASTYVGKIREHFGVEL